jgi:hypothetical protein
MKQPPEPLPALMGVAVLAASALAWCAAGCRSHSAPPAIDPAAAFSIPAGTVVLGAIDLDRLRAAPLYPKLPPAALALAESYRAAQQLMAAWNGTDLLIVAQGAFRETPPGATRAAPNLALSGSPAAVRAALAQRRTGQTGVPGLLAYAAKTAGGSQVWVVVQGGVALPFTGNASNLNRLFRNLEYASLAVDLGSAVNLHVTALGRTEPAAREFEENLRGFLSLASAAESRRPEIAALLDSVRIRRDGVTATAWLNAPPDAVEKLVEAFTR